MTFSPDSLAIFLLCSQLGLDNDSVKPLTLHEWNPLVRKMQAASLRPSDLLQQPEHDLRLKPDLNFEFVTRVSHLLSRDIQPNMFHVASLGTFPLTGVETD